MYRTSRWSWLVVSIFVIGGLPVGVVLPGCAPAPQQPPEEVVVVEGETVVVQPAVEPSPQPAVEPAKESTEQPTEEPAEEEGPAKAAVEPLPVEPVAEPAAPPVGDAGAVKVSDFAPAEDLASQVPEYIEYLEKALADEADFKDSGEKIGKAANTLAVIALGLGLHDQDNKYKAAAGALMKAAQNMAAAGTGDYASAQEALTAVKEAAAGKASSKVDLKWEKVASLPELMKQVPLVNTKLKRYVKGKRLKRKAKDSQGLSAVIAVIGHGSLANAGDTEKPDAVAEWQKFCIQMRQAAAGVNTAVRDQDEKATRAAMAGLAQSCDDCHTVFHQEALDKEE